MPSRAPRGCCGSTVQAQVIEPRVLFHYITVGIMTASTLPFAPLWRKHPREFVAFGSLAVAALIAAAGSAWSSPSLEEIVAARAEQSAPTPPPLLVRNIAPTDALAANQKIPVASGPNPAAAPFSMAKMDKAAQGRALECLSSGVN